MDYCGHCGEPVEGRFCRMCGTAVAAPGGAPETLAALSPAQGRGYGPAQGAVAAPADPTTFMAAPRGGYGPEPTQALGATPSDFDAYFRTEDGTPGLHGQTQLLPPVLDDYQAPAPQTGPRTPPGGHGHGGRGNGDGDGPRSNRPLLLVAGAVVVVAAVILGLLYLGNQSTGSNTASGTSTTPAATAAASQSAGVLQVPTDGASIAPTTAAPSTTSAAATGQFSGDNLPLGPGSSGEWVKWVQEKLSALGYYHGQASGSFDQATALAVQQFQAAARVTGDAASTVGMHTIVALAAAGSTPNLHLGSRSSDVSRLNTALSYATGSHLSGSRYTMSTAEAVARYQSAVGLTPNGQVDAATWAKLQDGTLANG
jgi:peptidoglycan hydrolase-like protein with peptidoglycan-binding domain